jgi:hypothetical protein
VYAHCSAHFMCCASTKLSFYLNDYLWDMMLFSLVGGYLWDMMLFSLVGGYQCFSACCCCRLYIK